MLLYFSDLSSLASSVELLGNIKAELCWYELEHGALLSLPKHFAIKIQPSDFVIHGDYAYRGEERRRILSSKKAQSLYEFLHPLPRIQSKTPNMVLMFFVSAQQAHRFILQSLQLGACTMEYSHIQFATIKPQQFAGSFYPKQGFLLKVKNPSAFLIEEHENVYAIQQGRFWSQINHYHPLISFFEKEPLLFLQQKEAYGLVSLKKIRWKSIFKILSPQLVKQPEKAALTKISEKKIPIFLTSIPRSEPAPATLYMLRQIDPYSFYEAIQTAESFCITNWSYSFYQGSDENYLLLRSSKALKWPFSALELGEHLGVQGLFLPCDQNLVPHIHEKHYRRIFQLKSTDIVVYLPTEKQLLRFENNFYTLTGFVEQLMAFQVNRLSELASHTEFHFQKWTALDLLPVSPATAPTPDRYRSLKEQ